MRTVEELEAKLEIVTKHRDAWKKMLDETNGHVLDMAALVEPGLHRHPVAVLQATHAFILNLMNERDEAKKEAAESSKEMIMLFSDHCSIELEKQLRIEALTRERDTAQDSALMFERDWKDACRERDEARAEVATAYRRGAEAMRDECIGAACGFFMGTQGFCNGDEDALEQVLLALPIPGEP